MDAMGRSGLRVADARAAVAAVVALFRWDGHVQLLWPAGDLAVFVVVVIVVADEELFVVGQRVLRAVHLREECQELVVEVLRKRANFKFGNTGTN
jgi:hypothetical protein